VIATTTNDGAYTDNLGRSTGTFRYCVSHPGGTLLSKRGRHHVLTHAVLDAETIMVGEDGEAFFAVVPTRGGTR
jgi:hypothetical protein